MLKSMKTQDRKVFEKAASCTQKHDANKHIKRCSTSSDIRETQIKTTIMYHYIPTRIGESEKSTHMCWQEYIATRTLTCC